MGTRMSVPAWRLSGEYFESCNCEVLCPCLLSRAKARPTEGHCDVVIAFDVKAGTYGDTDLGGTRAVLVVYTPGIMADGGWTVGAYVDERTTAEQRAALATIFSAQAGGPLGRFAPLIATRLEPRAAPITVAVEGRRRTLAIPGVAQITVEGIEGAGGKEVWLENVGHFASRRLAAARGLVSRFRDGAMSFENSGRNGHYSTIEWTGP